MTTQLTIIVAVARRSAIGRRGDLLFHISDDLKRFKALTMGCPIIMGRKTFESFPKGPLPGRRNIVITRNLDYSRDGIETAASLDKAISMCAGVEKAFIIGGGEVYRQAIGRADTIELTEIDAEVADADTFFPEIDDTEWHRVTQSETMTDPRSGATYRFVTLKR